MTAVAKSYAPLSRARRRTALATRLILLSLAGMAAPLQADPASAPRNSAQLRIDYYGDSTVWGYASGSGAQVAKPAPTAFAEALPGTVKYEVRNEGVSGSTACQLLNGTDGRHPPWASQMASSKAAFVILNHGINDQWAYDIPTYKSCLQALARTAKDNGKQVIFETPNPTRDSGADGLDRYVNAMKDVARREQLPVIDQYAYLSNYLQGRNPVEICPDGLHPSDAVYVMKGKYAANAFIKIHKSLRNKGGKVRPAKA